MSDVNCNSTSCYERVCVLRSRDVDYVCHGLDSEIAELMSVKSKHGSGGEYEDGWGPGVCDSDRTPYLQKLIVTLGIESPSTPSRCWPSTTTARPPATCKTRLAFGPQASRTYREEQSIDEN